MILSIVPELTDEVILNAPTNVKVLDYHSFNSLEVHPFIAVNSWDKVEIVLSKGIKSGYIKQLLKKDNIITAIIKKDTVIDFEIISRLGEIYPESFAALKKAFMKKEDIKPILSKEGVKFE